MLFVLRRPGAGLVLAVIMPVALGAGCAADPEGIDKTEAALAESGPWHIPPETLAIGDTEYVEYTGAGPWVGPSAL